VGFEPTTPVSERVKTVPALDRVATVIGSQLVTIPQAYYSMLGAGIA
jgi:hypothetical protein